MSFKTIKAPHILLPRPGVDLTSFAVIACDQFTSNLEYWKEVEKLTKNKPSTYHMMFPEAYLGKVDEEKYIENINKNIQGYLDDGVLVDQGECFILVDRKTNVVDRRLGLVISIDLEDYTYQKGVKSLIRASEATIVERIPPRLKIRENAPVELPHILFLFDDVDRSIIEPLYKNRSKLEKVYDFELNQDGGHLTGYKVTNTDEVIAKFEALLKKNNNGLLFIVGDGNHSLATAKAHWDKIKVNLSEEERKSHPARYALVEAMNIYDEGLIFEPIHRLLFNVKDDFLVGLKEKLSGDFVSFAYSKEKGKMELRMPKNAPMCYKIIQSYIDEYLASHKEVSIDYIHDESELLDCANKNPGSLAIAMPALTKGDVFDYIAADDVLPRKSFSMGHATEKRYYLESKKIK
jgi:uncharacterized protein (DUF1015 family)